MMRRGSWACSLAHRRRHAANCPLNARGHVTFHLGNGAVLAGAGDDAGGDELTLTHAHGRPGQRRVRGMWSGPAGAGQGDGRDRSENDRDRAAHHADEV